MIGASPLGWRSFAGGVVPVLLGVRDVPAGGQDSDVVILVQGVAGDLEMLVWGQYGSECAALPGGVVDGRRVGLVDGADEALLVLKEEVVTQLGFTDTHCRGVDVRRQLIWRASEIDVKGAIITGTLFEQTSLQLRIELWILGDLMNPFDEHDWIVAVEVLLELWHMVLSDCRFLGRPPLAWLWVRF